jgi:chromosome segregation ATPase
LVKLKEQLKNQFPKSPPADPNSISLPDMQNNFVAISKYNNDIVDLKNRLITATVSLKSIVEDSYSLMNSKIEKISADQSDNSAVEANSKELLKLNRSYEDVSGKVSVLDNSCNSKFTSIKTAFSTLNSQMTDNIKNLDTNKEKIKQNSLVLITHTEKLRLHESQIIDIQHTSENTQRALNIQLQKISTLSKNQQAVVRQEPADMVNNYHFRPITVCQGLTSEKRSKKHLIIRRVIGSRSIILW